MDSTLIAKVLPTKTDGKRSIGTGYPVAKNRIITARHVVVFDERDCRIPITVEWPDHDHQFLEAKVIYDGWDHQERCDIAVLECETPHQSHVSPLVLSNRSSQAHEPWESFGYPRIGRDEDASGARSKISALGKFHPPEQASHEVSLTSESDAVEKAGWRGISGAPVFQGASLYAVISSTPTNRNECFTAVSIPHLMKDAAFRNAVGLDELENDFHEAIAYLSLVTSARNLLYSHISENAPTVNDSSTGLVAWLVKQPIPDLIRLVHEVQKKHTSAFTELRQLLRLLLPSVFGFDTVSGLRKRRGNPVAQIIQLPYATDISAEMLMAACDKRAVDLKVIEEEHGLNITTGKYRLPLSPESGADDGEQKQNDIDTDLYNRFCGGELNTQQVHIGIDEHLYKIAPQKRRRPRSLTDKQTIVKGWLQRTFTNNKPGYYWLFELGEDEIVNSAIEQFATELNQRYPLILPLSLEYDVAKENQEYDLFNFLAETQRAPRVGK